MQRTLIRHRRHRNVVIDTAADCREYISRIKQLFNQGYRVGFDNMLSRYSRLIEIVDIFLMVTGVTNHCEGRNYTHYIPLHAYTSTYGYYLPV